MTGIVARFIDRFRDDWRGAWLSLLCGVAVLFAFSQAWQAPLFGYSTDQLRWGAVIRVFYYPFYGCGFFLAWRAWRRLLDATWRTPFMMTLISLCAVSYFWSIDPSGTMRRLIALFMTILCAYAIAARFSWRRLTEVLAIAYLIMMSMSIVLAVAFPHLGKMQELFVGAWRGVWLEKNSLGNNMAIGFVASAAAALHNPQRRYFWGLVAMGMVGTLLMSTSKTALVAAIIGSCGMAFVFLSRRGPVWGIVLSWIGVTLLMCLAGFMLYAPDHIFLLLGKDPTLTGRTFIWDGIARVMEKRPLLGYGYGVVWTDEDAYAPLAKITQVAGFRAYHAHSCWFEVWLALGIVGLCVWAMTFADTWIKGFYRSFRGDGGYFALPMLAIYSLSSLTESMALGWNDLRWALLVMVLVKLSLPDDCDSVVGTGEESKTPHHQSARARRAPSPQSGEA